MSSEAISIRTKRLKKLILGQYSGILKNKLLPFTISQEFLLDAFFLLYYECDKDNLKKRDKNISEFVLKYRSVIDEASFLRINRKDFVEKALIGKGYFGNVYLVVEQCTGDVYAMKKLQKSEITSTYAKEERDIMSRRCSDWITNLKYSFQDCDFLYLIMEYLPGGDLLSLMMRNGPFEEDVVKFYLAEITLAINDLHMLGFVHRDIKPENILIDRLGHIKLADFGNAASIDKDGYVTSVSPVGTPYYIAPELLQTISPFKASTNTHDASCDFWSMGIIGYEMVFETTPFYNENVHETYSKVLTYCEESLSMEDIPFPNDVKVCEKFRNLIRNLITKPSKRLLFSNIKNHKFFENTKWNTFRQEVPPFIPSVKGEQDISNFENIEKIRGKQTFVKKATSNLKSNDFSGSNLPFLGYGFIHQEKSESDNLCENNDPKMLKLHNKIKDMQLVMKTQNEEMKCIQQRLLSAEKKAKESDSTSKILLEAKDEILRMKERLKQKTIELAQCKTEIKTLQSSLKIEEEQRLKSDATISEVLSSTYKKWEKAKTVSDQNYEKQIAEKKTEIINLTQKLVSRKNDLATKCEELKQLHTQVDELKGRLQNVRDQTTSDKKEIEKIKLNMEENYETKLHDIKKKLRMEKDSKNSLTSELRDVRSELDESIQSTNSNLNAKIAIEKSITEIKQRLNREIELNNTLRLENSKIEKLKNDLEKANENLRYENEKLKEENQLREATKNLCFESATSSQYQSAHGSLSELHTLEEQLRNDLAIAKEGEDIQRNRADQFEQIAKKLEEMVAKMSEQPKCLENVLEKQNEKLEDKLATVREQMIIERQSARAANLSLWKVEKQVEDLQLEKKTIQRRLELTENKINRAQNQKNHFELRITELENIVKQKDNRIEELLEEAKNLKIDVQKEHYAWQKAEKERIQEKSEVLEHINRVHKLNEKVEDLNQKLLQVRSKYDNLSLENKHLLKELSNERDNFSSSSDLASELEIKLKSCQANYEMLKIACSITDQQLTEVEALLNTEIKKNKFSQEKIDILYQNVREKEEMISQLKKELNSELCEKIEAENRIKILQSGKKEITNNVEHIHKQLLLQQNQLINSTNDLYETQEKLELLTTEFTNVQIMNINFEKEISILKEENSRILTELFLNKEEKNKLNQELKISNQTLSRLKEENEQLTNSIEEQKNFYLQRDIKSEATLMQHKKLIDYLQLKVEDLSQKKKRSFADKLFGSATPNSKKENINPNIIESSILYRTLKEELNRERQKNKIFQERVETNDRNALIEWPGTSPVKNHQHSSSKLQNTDATFEDVIHNFDLYPNLKNIETTKGRTGESYTQQILKNHRFELNLDKNDTNNCCCVCSLSIVSGSPHWFCKECKSTVHRKCRGDIKTVCESTEKINTTDNNYSPGSFIHDFTKSDNQKFINTSIEENIYHGDFIMSAEILSPSLDINCAYDLTPDLVLLGTCTGLFAYGLNSNTLTKIIGVANVQYISASISLSKVLIVSNDGSDLLQCDLRQLQSRSQSNVRKSPSLETSKIDLTQFTTQNEKFHLIEISNEVETEISASAIAVGSHQIIIMKYDIDLQNFKPIHSLQCPSIIVSILFTRHTAIIGTDKFLELNFATFTMEEFIDFSDPTLNHLQNYQPMSIFNISLQEYLVCFAECGIFVDEYGCRSRPYELSWEYTPTGFLYQEPFLYISHFQLVQIIRLHRSYCNEAGNTSNAKPYIKRTYLNLYMSTILGKSGDHNCYSLAINKSNGIQELYMLDGLKSLKDTTNISMETISSQATCLTIQSE